MIKTTVKVDGMMCGMCESHVNDAVRKAFQVDKVTSSQQQRRNRDHLRTDRRRSKIKKQRSVLQDMK